MINLVIADWGVKINSNSPHIIERLADCFAHEKHACAESKQQLRGSLEMHIDMCSDNQLMLQSANSRATPFDLPRFKYKRSIDFENSQIAVQISDLAFTEANYLYHLGFLFPFSYFLRHHKSSLIHAALIERNGEGTLIVGKSGAGKSSLSIVLAHSGYNLFSDEHPLLRMEKGLVIGDRFLGSPALRAETFDFLKNSGVSGTQSDYKQKYRIGDSLKKVSHIRSCVIKYVIYPQYCEDAPLEVTPIRGRQSFFNLCKDDYLALPQCADDRQEKQRRSFHVELLLNLASNTKSYRLRYNKDGLKRLIMGDELRLN